MHTLQESNPPRRNLPPLSARLLTIAEGLPRGGVICDVGSDHGALPLFLLSRGMCKRAVVTDLHPLPLARAKSALTEAKVDDRADFVLADGIADVLPFHPDAFVIAGMGGETIAGILERARGKLLVNTYFALQPMTKARLLRRYLYENGFSVEGERAVAENGKVFLIFFAKFDGIKRRKEDSFFLLGEHLSQSFDPAVRQYVSFCLSSLKSKIVGMEKAGLDTKRERDEEKALQLELERFNEDL